MLTTGVSSLRVEPVLAGRQQNLGSHNVLIRLTITLFAAIVVMTGQVAAQEYPMTPDPALCTLEPRAIADVAALVDAAADQPSPPPPTAVAVPFVMPDGFSLVEDERAEIEKDLVRAIACINTGDPLKVFAAYSDRYVVALVEELGGMTESVAAGLQTVRPLDEEHRLQIVSIDDSILLYDGRALVLVTGDNPADDQPAGPRAFYLLETLPGRWLVDEVIEIELPES